MWDAHTWIIPAATGPGACAVCDFYPDEQLTGGRVDVEWDVHPGQNPMEIFTEIKSFVAIVRDDGNAQYSPESLPERIFS